MNCCPLQHWRGSSFVLGLLLEQRLLGVEFPRLGLLLGSTGATFTSAGEEPDAEEDRGNDGHAANDAANYGTGIA